MHLYKITTTLYMHSVSVLYMCIWPIKRRVEVKKLLCRNTFPGWTIGYYYWSMINYYYDQWPQEFSVDKLTWILPMLWELRRIQLNAKMHLSRVTRFNARAQIECTDVHIRIE